MLKNVLFFIVALLLLGYLHMMWENRHEKVSLHFFHRKTDMNLGLLIFAVLLDGAIITILLVWLLGYFK